MPTTVTQNLAAAVRRAGVRTVADRSGVHRASIYRWLRGERDLTVGTAERIADATGQALALRPLAPARKAARTRKRRQAASSGR